MENARELPDSEDGFVVQVPENQISDGSRATGQTKYRPSYGSSHYLSLYADLSRCSPRLQVAVVADPHRWVELRP